MSESTVEEFLPAFKIETARRPSADLTLNLIIMTSTGPRIFNLKNQSALFQHDIFLCVLDSIVAPTASLQQFRASYSVLFRLARTCRAFSGPSLDRLWYKLDSLEPLIRCYTTKLTDKGAMTPPTQAEWSIIRRYSHRVKELRITSMHSQLSMSFLRATYSHPSLLVPSLTTLSWHPYAFSQDQSAVSSIVFIQRLLSTSLVSLDITVDYPIPEDGTLQSFLANHQFNCPNLKSISIWTGCHEASPMTVQALSQAITQHRYLEHLELSIPIDDIALAHIAMSPKLKSLKLVLHPDNRQCILSDFIPFRNVESLAFDVWDISFAATFLLPEGQVFCEFRLCYHSSPTPEAVFFLFTALASSSHACSLTTVTLLPDFVDIVHFAPGEPDPVSCDILRSLFPLRHLCVLLVDLGRWFSLGDDDLVSLARNWPSLQILHLCCEQPVNPRPWEWAKYITFAGLLSLVECCPNIHDLSLSVDAREIPVDASDTVCHPALDVIHFPESPIDDARLVHDFLACHFPSVTEICALFNHSMGRRVDCYERLWKEVNDHLTEVDSGDSSRETSLNG